MDNKMFVDHDIKEDDVNESSDDESEDENDKLEQRAEELERQILDNKYSYDAHVELVNIYRTVLDLKSMREAYDRFASLFPLTDKLWLEWIKTEISVATSEAEKKNVLKLFQTSVKDYLSVTLWLEYVQYCIGHCTLEETRNVFEAAVSAGGLHIAQGSLLWDAYREFELVHLSLISEKSSDAWAQQANRVAECFKRQLSVPLLNIEETYNELQAWIKESNLPNGFVNETAIHWSYKSSCKLLDTYKAYENELLTNKDHVTVYQNYIKDVKQPMHVICTYERAVAELCLNSELWLQYYNYLQKLNMPTADILNRALRNCPWCEDLWVSQIREMEMQGKEFDEITLRLEAGLESILPAHGLHLWLSYLEYSNRKENLSLDQLNQIFDQAEKHLGLEGDPASTVARFHARILANKSDMTGARRIWTNILKHSHRGTASAWLEYATLERINGKPEELRRIFQNALKAVKDWPQSIREEWLMYERVCGTLQTTLQCIEKCSSVPKITEQQMDVTEGNATLQNGKRKRNDESSSTFIEKRKKTSHAEKESTPKEGKFANLTKQPELKPQLDIHSLNPDTTVFVSNISSVITEDRLRTIFPNAKQIDLMRDIKGKSRGHGYMQFESHADVEEVLTRDREPLDGRPIFISRFKPAREERQHAFAKGREDNKLFVKGLPHSATQEQIEDIFNKFGQVKVRLVLQRSGRPKGLAYVEYSTKEEAAEALQATNNTVVDSCTISVAVSEPPQKSQSQGGEEEFWRRDPSRQSRSRLQVPLIPRVLSTAKASATTTSTANSSTSSKSNQDFRNMLLGKK